MDPDSARKAIIAVCLILAVIAIELGGAFLLAAAVLLRHR